MTLEPCVICGKNPAPPSMACEVCDGRDPLAPIDGVDPDDLDLEVLYSDGCGGCNPCRFDCRCRCHTRAAA